MSAPDLPLRAKPAPEDPAAQEARVAEALRVIAAARPEAFAGLTEFPRLRPAERLAWMEAAAVLIEARQKGLGVVRSE